MVMSRRTVTHPVCSGLKCRKRLFKFVTVLGSEAQEDEILYV